LAILQFHWYYVYEKPFAVAPTIYRAFQYLDVLGFLDGADGLVEAVCDKVLEFSNERKAPRAANPKAKQTKRPSNTKSTNKATKPVDTLTNSHNADFSELNSDESKDEGDSTNNAVDDPFA
jgi:hypothetical protein